MRTIGFLALFLIAGAAFAGGTTGYRMQVLVDDTLRPEYDRDGTVYIEALRGRSYTLRLTNPSPYRVAVALAVDGLNTINAKHTDARDAAKWIIEPYDSIEIFGWQVSGSTARKFFFTGEKQSYGAALGQTENLGVIEAVFFRERQQQAYSYYDNERGKDAESGAAPSPAPMKAQPPTSDDYAATGMGRRTRHDVETIDIDLEPNPIASVRIRYEFRPQLVKMGILPQTPSPIERRERARGFGEYCPQR